MEFYVETLSKFTAPGMGLALTIAFGFWLSRLGKPYNGILFNVHKLIALAVVVLAGIQISKMTDLAASPLLIVLIVVGLCVVALFASGALMSIGKLDYTLTLTIHRVALAVLVIAAGTAIYLLNVA
jgi:phosphoglycerol transferase MdoB-like AlkP superfamily enzyme